jgi:threonine synthase
MKYYSTSRLVPEVSFQEAIFNGLPEDNGLYMPEYIERLPNNFFDKIDDLTLPEIGYQVAQTFIGEEIDSESLKRIIEETLNFDIPLVKVEEDVYSLELFHGPTLAFKDIGARFLARCLSYFSAQSQKKSTILVATSGDTGSAVAHGFLGLENIKVVILYPKGKVSNIQEKQLTTLGQNISTLEVDGTFDDCQALVKQAFLDKSLKAKYALTSANSINIARLIPQSFYYFWAFKQLKDKNKPMVVSVPSGNYGNITAGLFAKKMGLPIAKFIASTNVNDIIPEYLKTGEFNPKASLQTISNAMDVGNPSNFYRLIELYNKDLAAISKELKGVSFDDEATKEVMLEVYKKTNYELDPHGAVAYLGLKSLLKTETEQGVFFETAHPAKFIEVVEEVLDKKVDIPERLAACMTKEKQATSIANSMNDLVDYFKTNL